MYRQLVCQGTNSGRHQPVCEFHVTEDLWQILRYLRVLLTYIYNKIVTDYRQRNKSSQSTEITREISLDVSHASPVVQKMSKVTLYFIETILFQNSELQCLTYSKNISYTFTEPDLISALTSNTAFCAYTLTSVQEPLM